MQKDLLMKYEGEERTLKIEGGGEVVGIRVDYFVSLKGFKDNTDMLGTREDNIILTDRRQNCGWRERETKI